MISEKIAGEGEATIRICLNTIRKEKQALVFCMSKRSAESQAEKVMKTYSKTNSPKQEELSNKILNILSTPTKQCTRLANCVRFGIAFHHSGLNSKQRELIEDAFREGTISVICSTPTLAAGLDLPAFRTIIKDTKRFGARGMSDIPVLEYEQMSGRAGRPGKEDYGEAILIANKEKDIEILEKKYVNGEVEDIYSKLAVEPVLRMYILSLVAAKFAKSDTEIKNFFDKTFYAKQFGDTLKLHAIIDRVIEKLIDWNMLTEDQNELTSEEKTSTPKDQTQKTNDVSFMSAEEYFSKQQNIRELFATHLGERVSQIYLDPLSANIIIEALVKLSKKKLMEREETFVLNHILICTLEMRPLIRVKAKEVDEYSVREEIENVIINEDKFFKISTDEFLDTIKTTSCIIDWCDETNEDKLLEKYDVRPGELSAKVKKLEWLYYGAEELARIKGLKDLLKTIKQNKERVMSGVKKELLVLLRFKGIGRIRARKLYNNKIKNARDVKKESFQTIARLVGPSMAKKLKEQVGEKISENIYSNLLGEIKEEKKKEKRKRKKKGQLTLKNF